MKACIVTNLPGMKISLDDDATPARGGEMAAGVALMNKHWETVEIWGATRYERKSASKHAPFHFLPFRKTV